MYRETDIFLALLGVVISSYGFWGVFRKRIGVGFRSMKNLYWFGKKAQILGLIHFTVGIVMLDTAFLSWVNSDLGSRDQLLLIWAGALGITMVANIIATIVSLVTQNHPQSR